MAVASSSEVEICGEVKIGVTGVEWICIRPPHGPRLMLRLGAVERCIRAQCEEHWFAVRRPSR